MLRENDVDPRAVDRVALCSVVPAALHPVRGASRQYFRREPFVLQAGVRTGLKVRYRNPLEVGADRIAGAIAAAQRQPARNLIVVDCGTATTFDVVTAGGDYLGGVILPGVGVSAETLASRTAKLPRVEIARPDSVLGRSTVESIQSGLYHGHCGAIRHLVDGARPGGVRRGQAPCDRQRAGLRACSRRSASSTRSCRSSSSWASSTPRCSTATTVRGPRSPPRRARGESHGTPMPGNTP